MSLSVIIQKTLPDFVLDVAFECNSKRIGILGASGCGKSLTLRSIAGIIKPDDGRISFNDTVWFDKDRKINVRTAKRNVGYLFQNYALFPNMTVGENVAAALHGAGKNAAGKRSLTEILERFELSNIKDHRPDELSGGQQQRTALARIMACDPELLLLDEPFSAMDTFLREGMRLELIRLLDEYGKTAIIVSHDRDELYQMCDHMILMDNGRIISAGATRKIFEHPGTPAVARLTGCKNISRIQKLEDHRIKALDWNGLELITADFVSDDITHAGIRAHDFVPGNCGVNDILCENASVSSLPFEMFVTLECGLWWKQSRDHSDTGDDHLPQYISIPPERIILMKD
ncbi:MAG: ATP-binding cassette domain-containing protein [Lachnospiraceae bacterium]|nr:ATP-binding cassette domain-containing protein [Lachnospiraceae bacterium]